MIIKEFDIEKGLLVVKYIGEITINEILDYIISIANDKTLPRDLKIIEYTYNVKYNLNLKEIPIIINELKKQMHKFKRIKMCIIHTNPRAIAYYMLFMKKTAIKNYTTNLFSSENAAKRWLLNENVCV